MYIDMNFFSLLFCLLYFISLYMVYFQWYWRHYKYSSACNLKIDLFCDDVDWNIVYTNRLAIYSIQSNAIRYIQLSRHLLLYTHQIMQIYNMIKLVLLDLVLRIIIFIVIGLCLFSNSNEFCCPRYLMPFGLLVCKHLTTYLLGTVCLVPRSLFLCPVQVSWIPFWYINS